MIGVLSWFYAKSDHDISGNALDKKENVNDWFSRIFFIHFPNQIIIRDGKAPTTWLIMYIFASVIKFPYPISNHAIIQHFHQNFNKFANNFHLVQHF